MKVLLCIQVLIVGLAGAFASQSFAYECFISAKQAKKKSVDELLTLPYYCHRSSKHDGPFAGKFYIGSCEFKVTYGRLSLIDTSDEALQIRGSIDNSGTGLYSRSGALLVGAPNTWGGWEFDHFHAVAHLTDTPDEWAPFYQQLPLLLKGGACEGQSPQQDSATSETDCFQFDERTGTITGYTCQNVDVKIPKSIHGQKVTAIGPYAFVFSKNELHSVSIPHGVREIGAKAFSSCGLQEVEFPDSLESIGQEAFCLNKLTHFEIPKNLQSIGADAFTGNQISELKITRNLKFIGTRAFSSNKISRLELSPNTQIEGVAFGYQYTDGMEELIIPEGTVEIKDGVYQNMRIKKLVLPKSLKTIGENAFSVNYITDLELPEGLQSIQERAFDHNKLESISIPASVTYLGCNAFDYNPLTTITNLGPKDAGGPNDNHCSAFPLTGAFDQQRSGTWYMTRNRWWVQ